MAEVGTSESEVVEMEIGRERKEARKEEVGRQRIGLLTISEQ